MFGRRTLLGAALALPVALLARWLLGRESAASSDRVFVEEQDNGWRVIWYQENGTWFQVRLRVGVPQEDPPLSSGVFTMDHEHGACCDIDWWRIVNTHPDNLPLDRSHVLDDFIGTPQC